MFLQIRPTAFLQKTQSGSNAFVNILNKKLYQNISEKDI